MAAHGRLPAACGRVCPLPYFAILDIGGPVLLVLPLHLLAFTVTAVLRHGALAEDRPEPESLTEFYVWMAVGGMLGGVFNSLIAPAIFNDLIEYPLVLVLACLVRRGQSTPGTAVRTRAVGRPCARSRYFRSRADAGAAAARRRFRGWRGARHPSGARPAPTEAAGPVLAECRRNVSRRRAPLNRLFRRPDHRDAPDVFRRLIGYRSIHRRASASSITATRFMVWRHSTPVAVANL